MGVTVDGTGEDPQPASIDGLVCDEVFGRRAERRDPLANDADRRREESVGTEN
jgi:hypothetical protein